MKALTLFSILYALFDTIPVTHGEAYSKKKGPYSEFGNYYMCEHKRKYCGSSISDLGWPLAVIRIATETDTSRAPPDVAFPLVDWKDTLLECDITDYNKGMEWWPSDRLHYVGYCGTGECRKSRDPDGDDNCARKQTPSVNGSTSMKPSSSVLPSSLVKPSSSVKLPPPATSFPSLKPSGGAEQDTGRVKDTEQGTSVVDGKKVVVEMGPDAKNTIAELDKKITALAEKVEHLVEELGQQDEQDERNERGLGRAWTA